jgi:hypothetical protein
VSAPRRGRAFASAVVRRLPVMDDSLGDNADLIAGAPGTPAQVEVVAVERELWVEAAEGIPDIATYEHPGGSDSVDLAAVVMLALIMLPALEAGDAASGSGDAEAHLEQQSPVMPPEGLGAEDGCARVGIGGLE